MLLEKLTELDYSRWIDISTKAQAKDRAFTNQTDVKEEYQKLLQILPMLLPEGLDTPGHYFFQAKNDESSELGFVWIGPLPDLKEKEIFLYDIRLKDKHRSKGFGRKILHMVHEKLKEMGYESIYLNVLKANYAKNLYMSLSYKTIQENPSSLIMKKVL